MEPGNPAAIPTVPEHHFWLKAGVFLQPLVLDSASQATTDQRLSRVGLPRGLRRTPVSSERLARATWRTFMDPSFIERRGNGNHPDTDPNSTAAPCLAAE